MKGILMRPAPRVPFLAALAAAALLSVAGCGTAAPGGTAPQAAAPSGLPAAASGTSTASDTPVPSGTMATGPGPSSPAPAAADTATYTFPDGRLSFSYPADWRVELFTGGQTPATSGTASVYDAGGTLHATIYSGQIADGVSHPVARTVFESAPVPGLAQQPAPAAHYSFYVDRLGDNPVYRMHLTAGAPAEGAGTALDGIIRTETGVLVAEVKFIERPFADDAAARSWLAGAEGQALKALLLSISHR